MFVRRSSFQTLGAGLMTRDVACAQYAPGSFGWQKWNCGAGGASSPNVPAPAPAPYYPPPAPSPSAPGFRADDAAALRAQAEYNARIAAELNASEASRLAAQAQAERDAANASLANSFANASGEAEIGAAAYSNFGTGQKTESSVTTFADTSEKMPAWIWLVVAGAGALALSGGKKRRGTR